MTVELDPASGRLTYSKEGSPSFVQNTSIRSSTAEPVHFFASLYSPDDVSLV